jgi:PAS domain S-box-containing protein
MINNPMENSGAGIKIEEDSSFYKLNHEKLSKEKNLADTIIDSLPGVFYLYDVTGKFLRWNDNFEKVSGYTGEEISQMHPLDFFDQDEKSLLQERIAEVFATGD